jgi:hypothetical protein
MSSLLKAILPPPYHLINVFLQIANKLGYQKKKKKSLNARANTACSTCQLVQCAPDAHVSVFLQPCCAEFAARNERIKRHQRS